MHRREVCDALHHREQLCPLVPQTKGRLYWEGMNLLLANPRWSPLQVSALLHWANMCRKKQGKQRDPDGTGHCWCATCLAHCWAGSRVSLHPLEPSSGLVSSWDLEPL